MTATPSPLRALALFLVAANLALLAYAWPERGGNGEAGRLAMQVQADKIKLLSPQQVAALGPAKVAALADVCLNWGPFFESDRAKAQAELAPVGLGRLLTTKKIDVTTTHWVFLPPSTRRPVIDKRMAELQAAGIDQAVVVDAAPYRYTIALGAYPSEVAANAAAAEWRQKGVKDALAGPRQQTLPATQFVIRDPEAAVVARVRALQAGYPNTEIKVGPCEGGS